MARYVLDPGGNQINLDQFVQEPGRYVADFTLQASLPLNQQPIQLSGQEMYFAVIRLFATWTNVFRVRLYQSVSGRDITLPNFATGGLSAQARSDLLYGIAGRPAVLPAPWLIQGSGQIIHDFTEIAGATDTIHLEYEGLRLTPLH